MLDVHPPDHRISGTRDFITHMLTITLGLVIALGLEAAVETMHHYRLRREAEATIRQELASNRDLLRASAATVQQERANLLKLIAYVESISAHQPPADLTGMSIGFHEAPIPDSAWRTASTTGVLAFMDYAEVQRFAEAYKEQEMLQETEEKALDDYLQFSPILQLHGKDLSPELAAEALPILRRALAHVSGMLAFGQGTLASYDDALK